MKAADVSMPSFLSVCDKDTLEESGKFNSYTSGIPYTSDTSDALDESELKLNGRCRQFDLTKADDQKEYADLCAKLLTSNSHERLWEQRVPKPDGGLVVYVAYTELSRISYNVSIEIKDKENQ